MYQAKSGDKTYSIKSMNAGIEVDGKILDWDVNKIDERNFHVIHNNQSYRMELVTINNVEKSVTLKINGKLTTIDIKDKMDLLLEKMGIDMSAVAKVNDIKAPMPGLIFEINISVGDEVKKGDAIMILEAMKMENVLKSPGDGVVKAIKVAKGDSVEKNQVLVEF